MLASSLGYKSFKRPVIIMNMKSVITSSILFLLATSCHFYKEYDKKSFPTYSWKDAQEVIFSPTIDDKSKSYQITLGLRHLFALQLKEFDVNIKIVSPSGKETSHDYNLKIRDESTKPIGSCAGDLCDLEAVIIATHRFEEEGEHKIVVSHNEDGYRIPGIMEVGLIIDEKD